MTTICEISPNGENEDPGPCRALTPRSGHLNRGMNFPIRASGIHLAISDELSVEIRETGGVFGGAFRYSNVARTAAG